MTITQTTSSSRLIGALEDDDFQRFQKLCNQSTDPLQFPLSQEIADNVVIYSSSTAQTQVRGPIPERQAVMDEWQRALLSGPGVFVIRDLIPVEVIDRASGVAQAVQQQYKAPGNNSRRIFAYTEKHATNDPASFAEYYGNEILAAVCEAWLGPAYQITGSINATFRGGDQQAIHRDYHVSHQALDRIHRIPLVNQIASQFLTLQSAIAHTDMPLSTGPTRFMPFSQTFDKGYTGVRDPRYIDYVKSRMVQLELKKGDAVFFNPATFHQPGVNETDQERVANLLQVSSPFGRSMESCDRLAMSKAVWPIMKGWHREIASGKGDKTQGQLDALVAATCSDYGYPKVFDAHQPGPESQADIIRHALEHGTEDAEVLAALEKHQAWHLP